VGAAAGGRHGSDGPGSHQQGASNHGSPQKGGGGATDHGKDHNGGSQKGGKGNGNGSGGHKGAPDHGSSQHGSGGHTDHGKHPDAGNHQGAGDQGSSQKGGAGQSGKGNGNGGGGHKGAPDHGSSQNGGGGHTDHGKDHDGGSKKGGAGQTAKGDGNGSGKGAPDHGSPQKDTGGLTDDGSGNGDGSKQGAGDPSSSQKSANGEATPSRENPSLKEAMSSATSAPPVVAAPNAALPAISFVPLAAVGPSLNLPPVLLPRVENHSSSTGDPIEALSGVPAVVITACSKAIETAAAPFGAINVRVTSAGFLHQLSPDRLSAPIDVSIDYPWKGDLQTQRAPITCHLNATGDVIGLT